MQLSLLLCFNKQAAPEHGAGGACSKVSYMIEVVSAVSGQHPPSVLELDTLASTDINHAALTATSQKRLLSERDETY